MECVGFCEMCVVRVKLLWGVWGMWNMCRCVICTVMWNLEVCGVVNHCYYCA